jgi:hypothetical protein
VRIAIAGRPVTRQADLAVLVMVNPPTIAIVAPWPPKLAESDDAWQALEAAWTEVADAANARAAALPAAAHPTRRDTMLSLIDTSCSCQSSSHSGDRHTSGIARSCLRERESAPSLQRHHASSATSHATDDLAIGVAR